MPNSGRSDQGKLPDMVRVDGADSSATIHEPVQVAGSIRLARSVAPATPDVLLWWVIQQSTDALRFNNYAQFIDAVLCGREFDEASRESPEEAAEEAAEAGVVG